VIKVGVANRIAIYWIPLILLYFGARKLAWFSSAFDLEQGLLFAVAAIAFVLCCEVFMFGFRVELKSNELVYRFRGIPFPKTIRIIRSQIHQSTYEAAIRTDGKPWRFVKVVSESPEGRISTLINLTAFPARDVRTILDWMP
jgi:hypothetical protein